MVEEILLKLKDKIVLAPKTIVKDYIEKKKVQIRS
eukprot:CAMPEP_0116934446 /NCGR_PEP_ID=MMETSP0467-20121206/29653_1 /TAXON_ID=283647 /ORGANISM="Mesodinium pulex, Strain SPMC105" /LENGTH=34 /DNA_ID= /DNA_START= /DNA_END= /DNA_ORIENTATION=